MSYTNITKDLNESESLFEMTNLTPKRTGLNVIILSEQNTEIKNESSKEPKFKIIGKDYSISYSLVENPKILAKSGKIKHSDIKDIEDAIDYVCRNLDLFLKHFKMSAFEYDDDDFKDDLRKRGEYK